MTYAVPSTRAALDLAAAVNGSRTAASGGGATPRRCANASSAASIGSPSATQRSSRRTLRPVVQASDPTEARAARARTSGAASTRPSGS